MATGLLKGGDMRMRSRGRLTTFRIGGRRGLLGGHQGRRNPWCFEDQLGLRKRVARAADCDMREDSGQSLRRQAPRLITSCSVVSASRQGVLYYA